MQHKILNKILKKLDDPDLLTRLVHQLSFSELQSLLMVVYEEKRKSIRASDILEQYKSDPFLFPSGIDQRTQVEFDSIINSVLPKEYLSIELSPVSPLGCCSQTAGLSQNKVVSTIRKNEVCSDPTNMLALEASLRRKESKDIIRLAASCRALRTERIISKDSAAHFKIFSLCTAGRDTGSYNFEKEMLKELLLLYMKIFRELYNQGYNYSGIRIIVKCKNQMILDAFDRSSFENSLSASNTDIEFEVDKEENWNYYGCIRFQIFIFDSEAEYLIVDGGDTDWTQKILNNKKERYFISGLGSERFMMLFKPQLKEDTNGHV